MTGNCQLLGRLLGERRTVVSDDDNDSAVAVAVRRAAVPSVLFIEKSRGRGGGGAGACAPISKTWTMRLGDAESLNTLTEAAPPRGHTSWPLWRSCLPAGLPHGPWGCGCLTSTPRSSLQALGPFPHLDHTGARLWPHTSLSPDSLCLGPLMSSRKAPGPHSCWPGSKAPRAPRTFIRVLQVPPLTGQSQAVHTPGCRQHQVP